jgi:hypothetical protein
MSWQFGAMRCPKEDSEEVNASSSKWMTYESPGRREAGGTNNKLARLLIINVNFASALQALRIRFDLDQ